MKPLETTLWTIGVTLLALSAGGQAWGEWVRERGVSAFVETPQSEPALPLTQDPLEEADVAAATAIIVVPAPSDAVSDRRMTRSNRTRSPIRRALPLGRTVPSWCVPWGVR